MYWFALTAVVFDPFNKYFNVFKNLHKFVNCSIILVYFLDYLFSLFFQTDGMLSSDPSFVSLISLKIVENPKPETIKKHAMTLSLKQNCKVTSNTSGLIVLTVLIENLSKFLRLSWWLRKVREATYLPKYLWKKVRN